MAQHQHQTRSVKNAAHDEHAVSAKLVGKGTCHRPRKTPSQVLNGDGQRKGFTRPAPVHGDGLHPQPKTVADAHRHRDDHRAADEHLAQGQGQGGLRGGGHDSI